MKTYTITWSAYGYLDIEANSIGEAEEKFYALPKYPDEESYGISYIEELEESD